MRLHHLALRTPDVASLERFYVDLLGVPVMKRQLASVWLDAGGTIVMLEPRERDEPLVDPRSLELTCFSIAPADAPAVRARLAAASVPIEAETAFTLYFRDPDGRRVGVSAYPDVLV